MGHHIIFTCPHTGMNVQHWLAPLPNQPADSHTAVTCPACSKLHFINSATGKLLGEAKSK